MEITTPIRSVPLPRPDRGASTRVGLGRIELVLEQVRFGYALMVLDGQSTRTWSLGLAQDGELWLHCRVPRWPLRLSLHDTLVVVPGGRVRGYVQLPLVPTVVWRRGEGDAAVEEPVAELLPPMLSAEWDAAGGTCVQRWSSRLSARLPLATSDPRAVLPLTVRNTASRVASPESLPLLLHDHELRPCRGHLMLRPRRLALGADGAVSTFVRAECAQTVEPRS